MHRTTYNRHTLILTNIENNLYTILKKQTLHSTKEYIKQILTTLNTIKIGLNEIKTKEGLKQLRKNERELLAIINEFYSGRI